MPSRERYVVICTSSSRSGYQIGHRTSEKLTLSMTVSMEGGQNVSATGPLLFRLVCPLTRGLCFSRRFLTPKTQLSFELYSRHRHKPVGFCGAIQCEEHVGRPLEGGNLNQIILSYTCLFGS